MKQEIYKKANRICVYIILLTVMWSCGGSGNKTQLKETSPSPKDIVLSDTVKKNSLTVLGMKYKTKKDWSDFTLPNQDGFIITSKKLGKWLRVQDSVFVDNDGTLLSEGDPAIICDYISAQEYEYPNWLVISTQSKSEEPYYTLTGVIKINEGQTYSNHCKLKDDNYPGGICVGKYPIMSGDSISFEIENIYGITKAGTVEKLPLNTEIESCPEPFEPNFPEGRNPVYYYIQGDQKHTQSWQEL